MEAPQKKLCFPERFTPLEIPVVATRNRAGHYPPPSGVEPPTGRNPELF